MGSCRIRGANSPHGRRGPRGWTGDGGEGMGSLQPKQPSRKVGQVFLGLWRNSCYKFIMVEPARRGGEVGVPKDRALGGSLSGRRVGGQRGRAVLWSLRLSLGGWRVPARSVSVSPGLKSSLSPPQHYGLRAWRTPAAVLPPSPAHLAGCHHLFTEAGKIHSPVGGPRAPGEGRRRARQWAPGRRPAPGDRR